MAARKTKFANLALPVDDRTEGLSDQALICRTWGHAWKRRAASRSQTIENLHKGFVEYNRYCENGCGCTWRQVWNIRERMIVESERTYPKNGEYLLKPRSGRLRRNEAWAANFSREMAAFI